MDWVSTLSRSDRDRDCEYDCDGDCVCNLRSLHLDIVAYSLVVHLEHEQDRCNDALFFRNICQLQHAHGADIKDV